uniref:Uncharacterized protein n=1 Tax=Gouania willdenowi TaxID=441366 RepID=A0A8C5H9E7_GOUWI
MAPTRQMSFETKERIIKLLKSAVSKIWTKYKQHGKVVKGKHTGRPRKTSKHQDRKLKAICLENRKCTAKQKTGVYVCDLTKRTRLQWAKEKQSWTVDESHIQNMDLVTFEATWTSALRSSSCDHSAAAVRLIKTLTDADFCPRWSQ